MEILNNTTHVKKYLQNGNLTKPFIKKSQLKKEIKEVINQQKLNGEYATIEAMIYYLHQQILSEREDKEFVTNNNFNRTAQEIWNSGKSTGCTDFALVFVTLARTLGIPATMLATAEKDWLGRLKNNEDYRMHFGHDFCECFIHHKWILVDPTKRQIITEYNPQKLELPYTLGGKYIFIPYFRDIDTGKKMTMSEHNQIMDYYCRKLISQQ